MTKMPLLEVDDLVKHFPARRSAFGRALSTVKAVDGVSFRVEAGETLAIVGESGCGKSTVGRLVLNLIDATSGKVRFEGKDVASFDGSKLKAFRSKATLIFQDPYASLNPRMTIGDTLNEPLMLHTDLVASERHGRVGELLATVGLQASHHERYPHEFSGGQRQRVAIARALAASPQLVVCDEPVSALDVSIRAQVLNLLRRLQQDLGLALIFISHDLSVVKHIADRVAVMYLGRIVETAPTEALFAAPRHPYTQALLSAVPIPAPRRARVRPLLAGDPPSPLAPPSGCHLHPRCAYAVDSCSTQAQKLVVVGADDSAVACHRWQAALRDYSVPTDAGAMTPALRRLLDAYGRGE